MLTSAKIRSLIEGIVSQTIAFSKIAIKEDNTPLTLMCQKVLRECRELEQSCSLADPTNPPIDADRRLKADILESALYQLENLINDALLRLIFETFKDFNKFSLTNFCKQSQDGEQEMIDTLLDRLMQIGQFARSFANDFKVSTMIQSGLASIEAMEPDLCPDILSKYDEHHFDLLECHWKEETFYLQQNIQKIIDTNAFCTAFEDILEKSITNLNVKFDKHEFNEVLSKADVLSDHLKLNLSCELDSSTKDFYLMIKECYAGLSMIDDINTKRIIKRLKIMKTTVKRVKEALKPHKIEVKDDDSEEKQNKKDNFGMEQKKNTKDLLEQTLKEEVLLLKNDDEIQILEEKVLLGEQQCTKSILYNTKSTRQERSRRLTRNKIDFSNISQIIQESRSNNRSQKTMNRST